MNTEIKVSKSQESEITFDVVLKDKSSSKNYVVTLSDEYFQKIAEDNVTKEKCIEASFRFLLDKEPKESILSEFDLTLIMQYFPEFERKIGKYFD